MDLYGGMKYGREIHLDAFEPVKCRTLTEPYDDIAHRVRRRPVNAPYKGLFL